MHSKKLDFTLESILRNQFGLHQELELIKQLQAEPYCLFTDYKLADSFQLFCMHFSLYNALYRLRDKWLAESVAVISIELSRFTIEPYTENTGQASLALTSSDPLRSYYLDWQNFKQTNEDDLEQMLNAFWQKMACYLIEPEEKNKAFVILGIEPTDNTSEIKQAYKKLAQRNHPDKGGETHTFQQLNWAKNILIN
ncbi:DnaJ domain-containing protein [Catenovulum sp. SM1970]|uniref:DNA-J related domain-containing protein n=1 Tax=Marinifaba aquimaris TaxID=2741323 RepID=UPI001572A57C|nr:DNA-J related domain-containing protein [Marinifaba aquimaris]NTS75417.1 DnaJ domain-containing protein [Marinifaba aquimaris]